MRALRTISALFMTALTFQVHSADRLQPAIDASQISVSGVSSGAFMAQQLHVAYSDLFSGVGSVAGGPYYCAENMAPASIDRIKQTCMLGFGADFTGATYINKARQLSEQGKIAPISNLKDDRVFIFNSQSDQVINPLLGNVSRIFYKQFVDDAYQNIKAWAYIPRFGPFYPVAHGMPTTQGQFDQYENISDQLTPCAPSNSQAASWFPNPMIRGNDPWIYHCNFGGLQGYDLGKDILEHIYGDLNAKKSVSADNLYRFRQQPFVDGATSDEQLNEMGVGSYGYLYMPQRCKDGSRNCRLHVALHGCQQFPEWRFTGKIGSRVGGKTVEFGDLFYRYVYNELAEANDIVMLYPQAHNIGTRESDINPYGCWAFWAMADNEVERYYTREGREMKMIAGMVRALQAGTFEVEGVAPAVSR